MANMLELAIQESGGAPVKTTYKPSHEAQMAWFEYMLRDLATGDLAADDFSGFFSEIEADLPLPSDA